MQAHPLDRPVWNALRTRQRSLAEGDARALRLGADYGIFAAAADDAPESLAALAGLLPTKGQLALVEAGSTPAIPGAVVQSQALIWQMVAETNSLAQAPADFEAAALGEADAPQMLALASLTRPGPFFVRTHRFGGFIGLKRDGRLLAMAGERLRPQGFTEVSGVCTQPDCRGRGYAGALMRLVVARILARGETPFLHSYAHNTGAIDLYRSIGFVLRRQVSMTVLETAPD